MSEFSFKEHAAGPQSVEQTLNILTYEVGKILQCEEDAILQGPLGFKSHAQTELGDAISMLRYFCEQTKHDYTFLQYDIKATDLRKWNDAGQIPARISIYTSRVVVAFHYTKVFGSPKQHMQLGTALGGLKLLYQYYSDISGWDYHEVEKMGQEHYLERMAQIRKEGVQHGAG